MIESAWRMEQRINAEVRAAGGSKPPPRVHPHKSRSLYKEIEHLEIIEFADDYQMGKSASPPDTPKAKPMIQVAALYVETDGVYFGLDGVDPWDENRDARLYEGPWPIVAHPPCARWCKMWFGSFTNPVKKKGDDGGLFKRCLEQVRTYGGVIEHPAYSHAWSHFGIKRPSRGGGWVSAGWDGGWTCHVNQGSYGHKCEKGTWLYVSGFRLSALPSLNWGRPKSSFRFTTMDMAKGKPVRAALSHSERSKTPIPFRDLLISIAKQCKPRQNYGKTG